MAGLVCDDIRREVGGNLSFMGVCQASFGLESFPARQLLHVVVFFRAEQTGECTITTSLRWKDEIKWSVETTLIVEDIGGCTPLPMGNTVAGFDSPGLLSLEVTSGGETRQLATWEVESLRPDNSQSSQTPEASD